MVGKYIFKSLKEINYDRLLTDVVGKAAVNRFLFFENSLTGEQNVTSSMVKQRAR